MGGCQNTAEQFNLALLGATPAIAQEIMDLTFKMPRFFADNWDLRTWTANDNVMQQLEFRGSLMEMERGFEMWNRLASSAGCEPCVNDCSYNWTTFHGGGFNRRLISLMRREFKTNEYCVNSIKTSHEFELVFSKMIENIQLQIQTFKEYNIGFNFMTGIAKKALVDGGGIKMNSANPYEYRALGTATLSKLNTRMLTKFYEGMRRRTNIVPFDVQNGKPIYAITASDEVMDALYLEDANARADLRFSSAADALLTRYNFMESVRGQFINIPFLYPRRFDYVSGQWIEYFPYVNGIPADVGSFSDLNPQWENAPYEEVLLYGQKPFAVYSRPQVTTVGAGTDFGPEPSFMDNWVWVNIKTDCDPFRRSGWFATAAEIALAPQYSEMYGIMVPRPLQNTIAEYFPAGICPPEDVDCGNAVPAITTCPCPLVLSAVASAFEDDTYTITFATPIDADAEDTIQLGLKSGGYLTGTVEDISEDGYTLSVSFSASTTITNCDGFTFVFCDDSLGCSATVLNNCDCRSGITGTFQAVLSNPIKAVTANDVVNGYMGDGTVQEFLVVSTDMVTNTWTLKYNTGYGPTDNPTGSGDPITLEGDINCDRGGMFKICVPPETDATCPECGGPTLTPCAS